MSALDDLIAADIFTDAPECQDRIALLCEAAEAEQAALIAALSNLLARAGAAAHGPEGRAAKELLDKVQP